MKLRELVLMLCRRARHLDNELFDVVVLGSWANTVSGVTRNADNSAAVVVLPFMLLLPEFKG